MKPPLWVVGIDPGFDYLGFAQISIPEGTPVALEFIREGREEKEAVDLFVRSQLMAERVYSRLQRINLERSVIVVEDAAHGAKYGGELCARLRQALFEVLSRRGGVGCRTIPIKTAKKVMTGNGNADKEEMAKMCASLVKGMYPTFPGLSKLKRFAMADAMGVAQAGLVWHTEGKWTESASSAA